MKEKRPLCECHGEPMNKCGVLGWRCKHLSRADWLRWKYGLTPDQYDELLDAQGGVCAICERTPEENGNRLTVDHDHTTGKIRGLLCKVCNRDVGRIEKHIAGFRRYLEVIL
jgi:hypothetical protein